MGTFILIIIVIVPILIIMHRKGYGIEAMVWAAAGISLFILLAAYGFFDSQEGIGDWSHR